MKRWREMRLDYLVGRADLVNHSDLACLVYPVGREDLNEIVLHGEREGESETYQRVLEYRVSRDFERLERRENDQVRPEAVLLHFLLGQLIWSLH